MAPQLKAFFDRARVAAIADDIVFAWPAFPRDRFVAAAARGLTRLELMDRGRHIARALAAALPADYDAALPIVLRSLEAPRRADASNMAAFHWLPVTLFIADHGLEAFDASLEAQRVVTRFFSCEFAVRPFIERDEARALSTLARWTQDPNEHVRRLVSEGTRPRLPWAPRLQQFQADPTRPLALLERLKDDPSAYVRKSVANHLNDVSKDHPDVVVATCERWLVDASPERRSLVMHALRGLVRAAHPDAVRLAGGSGDGVFTVTASITPPRPRIGEAVRVVADVRNDGDALARAVLTLRVHFVNAKGGATPRSFRLPTLEVAPGASQSAAKTVTLRQLTTRTHHAGEHAVDVVVNGDARRVGAFTLRAA